MRTKVSAFVAIHSRDGTRTVKLIVAPSREALHREARHQGYLADAVTVTVSNARRTTVYVRERATSKLVVRK